MRQPPHPCPPPRCEGVLLPRVIAHEHRCIPRLCAELRLDPVPECACSPLCLQSLCAASQSPVCRMDEIPDGCGRIQLHVQLPVSARLRDGFGKIHCACGMVETCVLLPRNFAGCSQQHLHVEPHLQLLCAEPGCAPGCFHAQLHAVLEIYLLKLEVFSSRPSACACPQLPLYPPPMR